MKHRNLPIHVHSGRMFVRSVGMHHDQDVVAIEANEQTPMVYPSKNNKQIKYLMTVRG